MGNGSPHWVVGLGLITCFSVYKIGGYAYNRIVHKEVQAPLGNTLLKGVRYGGWDQRSPAGSAKGD